MYSLIIIIALDSCREEGNLTIGEVAKNSSDSYHLLKVCLFGHWSYVCHSRFNNVDSSIVLHQLGCDSGSKILANIL